MTTKKQYFLAAGVKADVEQFLTKFSDSETVRYEDFAKLWQEKNMTFLFSGRDNEMELREFTEDLLRITAEFLQPPYSFQVQVGTLYLLYGFYFKQPNNPRTRIRFTQTTWQHLQHFRSIVNAQKHMDVEFIYLKLLHTHAFEFVHSLTQDTPISTGRSGADISDEDGKEEQRRQHLQEIEDSMLKDALNLNLLSELHSNYQDMKINLGPKGAKRPHTSLDVIQNRLCSEIEETIDQHEDWRQRKISGKVVSEEPSNRRRDSDSDPDWEPNVELSVGERRARLKERAYQISPKRRPRRHQGNELDDLSSVMDRIGRKTGSSQDDDSEGDDVQMPGTSGSDAAFGSRPDVTTIDGSSSDESSEGATSTRRKSHGRGRRKTRGKGKGRGKGRGRGKSST